MSFAQDLRVATRSLARTPGFTALSTTVLALGLAVVVVMFAILWEVSFEPPPIPNPETMVGISTIDRAQNDLDNDVSPHDFVEWQRAQTVFTGIAAEYDGTVTVSGDGPAERYSGGFVSGAFFELMGLPPLMGRSIEERDTLSGAAPVVVLGQDLWRTRFNSDPQVVGRALKVNGEIATIIGVMAKTFGYPAGAQLWVPMRQPYDAGVRGEGNYVSVLARLKEGVTIDEAAAYMALLGARLAKQYPETNAAIEPDVMPIALSTTGRDDLQLLETLFASVFLVLIIACVNVSGLMLVRATARTQEAGIRRAIGAGRWRLMRQMLAEALVIGALAALLGLTLAAGALEGMSLILPSKLEDMPAWWDFSVDARIAAFCIGLALLSTLAAALYPALRVSGLDVNAILREGTRDTGLSTGRVVRWLVVVEIALSCALLTTTGLMVRTAVFAAEGDVGADVRPFMVGRVGLVGDTYPEERQQRFLEQLFAGVQGVPGSTAATITTAPPVWGAARDAFALPDNSYASQADFPQTYTVGILPGFFSAFRLSMIKGRDFTVLDRAGSEPVAIVNDAFVRRFFPSGNAIGQRVRLLPNNPDRVHATPAAARAFLQRRAAYRRRSARARR
jgi:putative ABC transport system permease protein